MGLLCFINLCYKWDGQVRKKVNCWRIKIRSKQVSTEKQNNRYMTVRHNKQEKTPPTCAKCKREQLQCTNVTFSALSSGRKRPFVKHLNVTCSDKNSACYPLKWTVINHSHSDSTTTILFTDTFNEKWNGVEKTRVKRTVMQVQF